MSKILIQCETILEKNMERVYHYTTMDAFLGLLESVKKSSDMQINIYQQKL